MTGNLPQEHILEALNAPSLLTAREHHFARLESLYAGEKPDQPFYLHGVVGWTKGSIYTNPDRWLDGVLNMLADEEQLAKAKDLRVFRPLVVESFQYGVRFVDRIFGAHVYETQESWWGDGLRQEPGQLAMPDLAMDPTWAEAKQYAQRFLESGVAAPLFGLPTIASTLNIAYNLLGEGLLIAMLTDPDAVKHDFTIITDLLRTLHAWYLNAFPINQLQPVVAAFRAQPPGFGQVCGCTTHLLSRELYEEFAAPGDRAVLSAYPRGGMIHLCGSHTQHIPVWRDMPSLRAFQLNDRASEDFETYYEELRDDQVIYLNPTPTMTAERALKFSGGHRLVIVAEP